MKDSPFSHADRYVCDYGRLAEALGFSGTVPAPGESKFLQMVTEPGRFNFGMLAVPDVLFAAAVTSILRPEFALEIGTASGSSAAVIAKMIALREAQIGCSRSGPLVHTIDKKAEYVFDKTKPVGFGIDFIAPELRDRIAIHPLRDSSHCREIVEGGELRLGFIDGNHQHPWPLVDLLHVAQVMKGGWILLHDIDLPAVIERAVAAGQQVDDAHGSGAKYVFDCWPDQKIAAGNIGAIRVSPNRDSLGRFLARLRELPSEVSPGSWSKRWRAIDALIKPPPARRWLAGFA